MDTSLRPRRRAGLALLPFFVALHGCGVPGPANPAPATGPAELSREASAGDEPGAPAASGDELADERAAVPRLFGRVVDPDGRPMAGVPVKLYGGFGTRWEVGATVTDADGRYAFESLEGRGISINGGRQTYVGVCVGEGLGSLNPGAYLPWTDVTIPRGESLEHDVVLDLAEVARRAAAERERR